MLWLAYIWCFLLGLCKEPWWAHAGWHCCLEPVHQVPCLAVDKDSGQQTMSVGCVLHMFVRCVLQACCEHPCSGLCANTATAITSLNQALRHGPGRPYELNKADRALHGSGWSNKLPFMGSTGAAVPLAAAATNLPSIRKYCHTCEGITTCSWVGALVWHGSRPCHSGQRTWCTSQFVTMLWLVCILPW